MKLYETLINDSACEKTDMVDMEQLQKKYELLQQIVADGNY